MHKTYKIIYKGQVQGVGFRPRVYVLAHRFNLKGTVSNNEEGVIIYFSGLEEDIQSFYKEILANPPKVAKIKAHTIEEINFKKFDGFKIIPSEKSGRLNLPLTPDFAICDDCKNEISDTQNRRFRYPFTTCVNCGPRWAITETFPFERKHTSIDKYPMCDACLNEYTDPIDRRFHSQTNTCHNCGIDLYLTDNKGDRINVLKQDLFKEIACLLLDGNIVAIKNISGYLLCCNAENEKVVQNLRKKKNRPNKPFALLYPSLDKLKTELNVEAVHLKSLSSTELPITIISSRNYRGKIALKAVAPGINQLGVMLPYSGILQLLASELSFPIVATSGNVHGAAIISNNKAEKIANIQGTWNIKPIPGKENLLLQGNYLGIYVLGKTGDKWVFRNKIEGYNISSRYFEFINTHEILISHEYQGVNNVKVDSDYTKVIELTEESSITKGLKSSLIKYNNDNRPRPQILLIHKNRHYRPQLLHNRRKKRTRGIDTSSPDHVLRNRFPAR